MKGRLLATLLLLTILGTSACAAAPAEPLPESEATPEITAPEPTPEPEPTEVVPEPTAQLEPVCGSLTLVGGTEMEWLCGIPFQEPGFLARGKNGEDRSERVTVSGKPCCWQTGTYVLDYCFTDDDGEQICAQRVVQVIPQSLPETVAPEEKVIYLTFDDGPCENTRQVLEILEKYDAKATFFVLLNRERFLDILPEIQQGGHTIGIHGFRHAATRGLYDSERSFFEDFLKAQETLYAVTGSYATISRFPGGSRTANGYLGHKLPGGMEQVGRRLAEMGVRYYDWNAQIEASTTNSSQGTFENFCAMVPELEVPICLQHDTRAYSVNALEKMLQWGTENGYRFRAMDNTVPEVQRY